MKKSILLPVVVVLLLVVQISVASAANDEKRIIAHITSEEGIKKIESEGCKVVHKLTDATSFVCKSQVASKIENERGDVEEDQLLRVLDIQADRQINADKVWALGYTGSFGTPVAVLDTGVDTSHRELTSSIVGGQSFVSYTTSFADDNGHGTHVSGIITSDGVDPTSKGVAPDAGVWMAKVCDGTGSCYTSDIAAAIDYVVTNKVAKVMSISLGGGGTKNNNCDGNYLASKINWAYNNGVVSVVAAGNSGTSVVSSPACASNAIAVAAVDSSDNLAWFSSYGNALKNHGVAAPGVDIYSTILGSYARYSGTSMATPHVSATVALMLQKNSGLTAADIRTKIFNSANCLGNKYGTCPNIKIGFGRVDALAAVNAVVSQSPDFSISSFPSALTIQAGASGSSTINVTSLNGFSGTVLLTISYPYALTPTLSPSSLTITPGGFSSSALTISASTTAAGTYTVTVTGTNGSLTHNTTVTVTVPTVPSAPQNLKATSGNAQVTLSWSAPSNNGGSAITSYRIYRNNTTGTKTLLTSIGNVLTYTDTAVTNGQTYYYQVTAVNSIGESTRSNEANATPSAPTLISISVTPVNPSIILGSTQKFTAIGTYSGGTTVDITNNATWNSSNLVVATVSASGLATALSAGTSTIKATYGAVVGSTTLTVTAAPTPTPCTDGDCGD